MYNTDARGSEMTAQDLAVWMVREHPYLMREFVQTYNDRYAQDPADRSYAYAVLDVVQRAFDFTRDEALAFIRMTTSEV